MRLTACLLSMLLGLPTTLAAAPTEWPVNGGNDRGEHFSPLDQVNEDNVGTLGLDWSLDLPAPNGIAATPIVHDGTIYLSGPLSIVWAIDAASGRLLWSFDPQVRIGKSNSWTSRVNRGVAVHGDRVLVTVSDCRLIGLDRKTGTELWSQLTCDPEQGYSITDAPHVGGGRVFVGNAGSESHRWNRGYVSAYDAGSGEFLWRFHIVPSHKPEENTTPAMQMAYATWSGDALEKYGGGGSNWNGMTYDPDSGLLYFGTAGAIPYVYEKRSPGGGDNLFTSSVVAVRADTGEYVWHYSTVPQDSWEYNATMNIVLADLPIHGQARKTLLIAPKNGFFYVLDRGTGELLSANPYVKVNWATHIDLETGRPVLDPEGMYWKAPPGTTVNVWPNMWGAHSTQPMAFHPGHRLAYIPAVNVPSVVSWRGDGEFGDTLEIFDEVDGKPHVPGMLVAWDPLTQSRRWAVEHDVAFNGGVLATAGNLVFQGDANGLFSAYRADTGERLWSAATGSAITAAPVSYLVDGRQRVLIPVGAGSAMQFAYPTYHAGPEALGPTRLLSFSLDGKAALPAWEYAPPTLPELPPLTASAQEVDLGRSLFQDRGCSGCHGKNAVARVGGSVPDLRYATPETHLQWPGIVIGGARSAKGMPAHELSAAESEAIRSYVLSRAHALKAER
ncbi:MAG: PQQ-dependent dehydrogenase, methanol/ethanol family [Lysobacterales bacterium]|nr:MAG: PQQ-dependent dehydrogenase, methanol/ethanol family [Xanthomonadales bacterium]